MIALALLLSFLLFVFGILTHAFIQDPICVVSAFCALLASVGLITICSNSESQMLIYKAKYESLMHEMKCKELDASASGEINHAENYAFCEMSDGKFVKIENLLP